MGCAEVLFWREPVLLLVSFFLFLYVVTTGRNTALVLTFVFVFIGVGLRVPLQHYCGI